MVNPVGSNVCIFCVNGLFVAFCNTVDSLFVTISIAKLSCFMFCSLEVYFAAGPHDIVFWYRSIWFREIFAKVPTNMKKKAHKYQGIYSVVARICRHSYVKITGFNMHVQFEGMWKGWRCWAIHLAEFFLFCSIHVVLHYFIVTHEWMQDRSDHDSWMLCPCGWYTV